MSEDRRTRQYPASEVRPLDYPDDVPFIANAACWIRERDDARIVIWGDEDRPGTLDVEGLGGFPLALDEVQSIVAQSGDDRAALKKSLAAMLINSRRESKNRGSLQLAGNGEARSMDDRTAAVVAQSTQDGLERRRGAFAGGSSFVLVTARRDVPGRCPGRSRIVDHVRYGGWRGVREQARKRIRSASRRVSLAIPRGSEVWRSGTIWAGTDVGENTRAVASV